MNWEEKSVRPRSCPVDTLGSISPSQGCAETKMDLSEKSEEEGRAWGGF